MRTLFKSLPVVALLGALFVTSCKPEKVDVNPVEIKGKMNVGFEYVFGSAQEPFSIGKTYVQPKTGDTLTFSLFQFYISNFKLKDAEGNWWVHPNSYFLLNAESKERSTLTISDIPAGTYTEMEYTMGVDSAMNVSGVYEGALSLINNMYWDWNSGFIMLKAEGKSPNAPSPNTFAFHLGGFSGADNIVTVRNTNFDGGKLTISDNATPTVTLVANPARLWHSTPGLATKHVIHSTGDPAPTMAKDFYTNIAFKSIN